MGNQILFALSPLIQREEIERYCYGQCGKALSGSIRNDIFGHMKTCEQRSCDFEIRRMEIEKGVCLRRLGTKYYQAEF